MSRVRIWTAPERLIGEAVIDELREAGLPVLGMPSGTELYPSSPLFDIFLEDDRLLESPEVQETIRQAIEGRPLSPEEEEAAVAMPFEDPDARAAVGWMRTLYWAIGLVIAMAIVAGLYGAWLEGWRR